ncbi:MAG: SIS domain-containing protein [Ardenticatenaceae bacterium]|nr:SIS domain-containing protein [Ardenticatenaceae bacterium]
MTLYEEIHEQPAVLAHSLEQNLPLAQAIAGAVPAESLHHVFIAARGTSDNAARYANYLWGAKNHLPVTLATPSLFSLYQQPPRLQGALVVGVSQSGESPDIVNVVAEGRRQGQPTLAITNEPESPLAQTADFVINIHAGRETAVAATKTYTAQLLAIALLSAAWSEDEAQFGALNRLPDWVSAVLAFDEKIKRMAERYRYMQQCVILGRGFNYATVFEWSLKLKELTYVVALPYSSADFRHGPIAIVDQGFPIMAVAPRGAVLDDVRTLLRKLAEDRRAELLVISDDAETLSLTESNVPLPDDLPEWISPLVSIVPAQLFCYHLTRLKGYDTEAPRGLNKVTHTI